jgi:hypothetical protein
VIVVALALLVIVIFIIGAPLRSAADRSPADTGSVDRGARPALEDLSPERAELEAAREAKYREIRDAELDYRTGKLSPEDYAAVDGALRAEALEILNRLQRAEDRASGVEDAKARPRVS